MTDTAAMTWLMRKLPTIRLSVRRPSTKKRSAPYHIIIHQDQLAVEFAALHICPQQEKAQQAPDGFIQKRRVHRQGRVHRNALRGQRFLHA